MVDTEFVVAHGSDHECAGRLDAPEQVTLDLNALAVGKKFMALGAYTVSDDGRRLAYSTDDTGFRQYTLFVKDLSTGETSAKIAEKVGSVAWAADNATLFYTVEEDQTKRQYRLYRHVLGSTAHDLVSQHHPALHEIGRYLGAGIANLANLFAPELVVIGGGFGIAAFDQLLPGLQEVLQVEALEGARDAPIVRAELGEEAGVVGAALIAFDAVR